VAGCATPSGSAGHAGETANLKLTSTWTTQRGLILIAAQMGRELNGRCF
jgi:hypothetical protein